MTGEIKPLNGFSREDRAAIDAFWKTTGQLLFQVSLWLRVFKNAYGVAPYLFVCKLSSGIAGIVPLVPVRKCYISLPFLDYTAPVCKASDEAEIMQCLVDTTKNQDADLHIRSRSDLAGIQISPDTGNVVLRLALPRDKKSAWDGFIPKVRNHIRKAEKNGVQVVRDECHLSKFYRLWARHITRLGTPIHGYSFFASIFSEFSAGQRTLYTAWLGDQLAGGLIMMQDKETAYVPWAASNSDYKSLCINYILYWEAIRDAIREGKKEFDFLRSQPGSGTYIFKKQWGAKEEQLYYYSTGKHLDPRESVVMRAGSAVWRRLPIWLGVRLGPRFRRYIP